MLLLIYNMYMTMNKPQPHTCMNVLYGSCDRNQSQGTIAFHVHHIAFHLQNKSVVIVIAGKMPSCIINTSRCIHDSMAGVIVIKGSVPSRFISDTSRFIYKTGAGVIVMLLYVHLLFHFVLRFSE